MSARATTGLFAALLAGICVVSATGASAQGGASCPGANATIATASPAALAQSTACLINAERANAGLSQLSASPKLQGVAQRQDLYSLSVGHLTHVGNGGIVQRVKATGFLARAKRFSVGEVLASGSGNLTSPAVIVNAWISSSIHSRVLLLPRFKRLGVAVVIGTPSAPGDTRGATFGATFGFKRSK